MEVFKGALHYISISVYAMSSVAPEVLLDVRFCHCGYLTLSEETRNPVLHTFFET